MSVELCNRAEFVLLFLGRLGISTVFESKKKFAAGLIYLLTYGRKLFADNFEGTAKS